MSHHCATSQARVVAREGMKTLACEVDHCAVIAILEIYLRLLPQNVTAWIPVIGYTG